MCSLSWSTPWSIKRCSTSRCAVSTAYSTLYKEGANAPGSAAGAVSCGPAGAMGVPCRLVLPFPSSRRVRRRGRAGTFQVPRTATAAPVADTTRTAQPLITLPDAARLAL
ncbi:hypothetical protein OPV22_015105 [Ensete ventricosum]|uniref:Uncharacterized protein n=1 Tax=Ensete ventricosum TaxID=4639 RepID=A0AAV8PRV4_ENSVE|nr:hypothetical protein OPV22_015105 [Ensete ventricosum]